MLSCEFLYLLKWFKFTSCPFFSCGAKEVFPLFLYTAVKQPYSSAKAFVCVFFKHFFCNFNYEIETQLMIQQKRRGSVKVQTLTWLKCGGPSTERCRTKWEQFESYICWKQTKNKSLTFLFCLSFRRRIKRLRVSSTCSLWPTWAASRDRSKIRSSCESNCRLP